MSNPNIYDNFGGSSFTFHNNYVPIPQPILSIPPPPRPPPIFIPPFTSLVSDQEFVKSFEPYIRKSNVKKPTADSISVVRENITNLVLTLEDIKMTENMLQEKVETISDEEWKDHMKEVEIKKENIERILDSINDTYLDMARKLLAKRSSKRLRMKRVKMEKMKLKKERIKQMEEKSRKIDENLKKIQDDIKKTMQEAEAKFHADMVLKEVLIKKNDAKKCIFKLDALLRLRKARQNTAKGRGDTVSENDIIEFNKNIAKLKELWSNKLMIYEKEESDLRTTLKQSTEEKEAVNETEKNVLDNLRKWRELLFGDRLPQVNFRGDVERFISARSNWDQFVCTEGTSLPVGWVVPKLEG